MVAIDIMWGVITVLCVWFGLADVVGAYRHTYHPLLRRSIGDFLLAFSCVLRIVDQALIATVTMMVALFWIGWFSRNRALHEALEHQEITFLDLLLFRKRDQHRPK